MPVLDAVASAYRSIPKHVGPTEIAPNLRDYEAARASFTWADARRELSGLPGNAGLNIAH